MNYDSQRAMARRMVQKYGIRAVLERTELIKDPVQQWKTTETKVTIPIYFVTFADDGTVFINHNIQGDVRTFTIVGNEPIEIRVGDTIRGAGKSYVVREAKSLDPDLSGAILWAALAQ